MWESWDDNKLITQFGNEIYNLSEPEKHDIKNQVIEYVKRGFYRDAIREFMRIQPLFYDKSGLLWMWNFDDYSWEIIDEIDFLVKFNEIMDDMIDTIKPKIRNRLLDAVKQEGRRNMPKKVPKTWIQFKNKIVDVKTGEEYVASPLLFVTNPIPWELPENYKEMAIPWIPTIHKLFCDWVGEKNVDILYQIMAYSMLPDYPLHYIFCLNGSGANGKSTFLNLLHKFLGEKNITTSDLDVLLSSRFEISALYKKLVCLMGETNFGTLKKTSLLKRLVGQDPIRFEFKGKDPFTDYNYAKIIIATNSLPMTADKTKGFYRRWIIVDFPNEFKNKRDVLSEIPDYEFNYLAGYLVRVLGDLLRERKFAGVGSVEQQMKRYESVSNPVKQFIYEYCVKDPDGIIPFHEFYDRLTIFLKDTKRREMSVQEVGRILTEEGYERIRKYVSVNGVDKRYLVIVGIRWKDSIQNNLSSDELENGGVVKSEPDGNTFYNDYPEW